jgi:hypothetical protein
VPNGNRYISGGDYVDDKGWDCVGIIIKGEGWDEDGGAEGRDLEGVGCDDEGIYVGCDEGGSKPILSNGVLEGVATACDGKGTGCDEGGGRSILPTLGVLSGVGKPPKPSALIFLPSSHALSAHPNYIGLPGLSCLINHDKYPSGITASVFPLCSPNVMRYGASTTCAPSFGDLADGVATGDGFTVDLTCDGGGVARQFASRARSASLGVASGICWDAGGG